MILALGLNIKSKDPKKPITEKQVLGEPIGHHCFSGDEERSLQGVKQSQTYYINGSSLKAVEKTFEEINEGGSLFLEVTFNYFNWPLYDENGGFVSQEIGATKKVRRRFTEKQVFNRRRKQRDYSIKDLESLGFKLESMGQAYPDVYPQMIKYSTIMGRIFKRFQLDINSFIDVKSDDFKNGILAELQGSDQQLKDDLNTLIPTTDDEGNTILIETWKGIYARL